MFRDSQAQALKAQAETRSRAKAQKKAADSGTGDLFAEGEDAVPNDRSWQIIKRSQAEASARLEAMLADSGKVGMAWSELWPPILDAFAVTHSWLGHQVNARRKAGRIVAPGWPSERHQIPGDRQRLVWA